MASRGTPESESSETKLCRSSRGIHAFGSSPAASTTLRKSRRTLWAVSGVPFLVVKTRASAVCVSWISHKDFNASAQRCGSASVRRDLLVFV